jgi:hypothetical protein
MKKIYVMPETKMVLVKIESLLNMASLQGEAGSSTVGFTRDGGSWDDED